MTKSLILLFIPCISFSQTINLENFSMPVDSLTGTVKYEKLIDQKGTEKELYQKAKLWISSNFKSDKAVIETDDTNIIVGKGFFNYSFQKCYPRKKKKVSWYDDNSEAQFTLKLFLKDNKYKVVITEIVIPFKVGSSITAFNFTLSEKDVTAAKNKCTSTAEDRAWAMERVSEYENIDRHITETIENIQSYMSKKSEPNF